MEEEVDTERTRKAGTVVRKSPNKERGRGGKKRKKNPGEESKADNACMGRKK